MHNKILMFSSTWHKDYTANLLNGVLKALEENDSILHVFNTYDSMEKTDLIQKEQDILFLPNLDDYDGMIIVYNSVGQYPLVEKVVNRFLAKNKPIICIDQSFCNTPVIGIDNYQSFYQLVEHMITMHHCKTFNYLGGPIDNQENQQRFCAFRDCLMAHGLMVDPSRILHMRFLHTDGQTAYRKWKETGKHLPDAVICANDHSALGYIVAAKEDNYTAPRDFLITGFDNIYEAEHFSPSITSVNRSWEEIGYNCASQLFRLLDGEAPQDAYYIPGTLKINESCGCHSPERNVEGDYFALYQEYKNLDYQEIWHRKVLQLFCQSTSIKTLQEAMSYSCEHLGFLPYALCFNDFKKTISNEDLGIGYYSEELYCITPNSSQTIRKRVLVPDSILQRKDRILFFSPLHFANHNFGYCLMPYQQDLMQYDKHRKLIDNVSLAIECTSRQSLLEHTNADLKNLYVRDQLTGLYNRFGYVDIATRFYQEQRGRISLFYIDVDNLKPTNDTFGHAMGDEAIFGISHAIETVFGPASIKVRMGGDEFLVIDSFSSELENQAKEQQFMAYLEEYTMEKTLPFKLSASIGHIQNDSLLPTLEQLVHKADAAMYNIKQAKKAAQA